MYSALGTVITTFSMLIKSSTVAISVSLCYIIFSETFFSIMQNIKIEVISDVLNWLSQHTIYGMSLTINSGSITPAVILEILLNSTVIIVIFFVIRIIVF